MALRMYYHNLDRWCLTMTKRQHVEKKCSSHQESHFSLHPSPRGPWRRSHSDEPCSLAGTDCCESCERGARKRNLSLKTLIPLLHQGLGKTAVKFLVWRIKIHKCTWLEPAGWAAKAETGRWRGFCTWELQLGCSPPQSPQPWPHPALQANVPVSPRPTWHTNRNSARRRLKKRDKIGV